VDVPVAYLQVLEFARFRCWRQRSENDTNS